MFRRENEGVRKEGIAEEDGRMGPVGAVGRIAAMPGVGTIQDIVVNQRGEVD